MSQYPVFRLLPIPFLVTLAAAVGCSAPDPDEGGLPNAAFNDAPDNVDEPSVELATEDRAFLESDDDVATEVPFDVATKNEASDVLGPSPDVNIGETNAQFLPLVAIGAYELAIIGAAAATTATAYYMRTHESGDFSGILGRFSFRGRGVSVPAEGTKRGTASIIVTDTQRKKSFSYHPRYVAQGTANASSIVFAKARNAPAWAKTFEDAFSKAKRAGKSCSSAQWNAYTREVHNLCDQLRSCSSVNECGTARYRTTLNRKCAEARKKRSVRCAGFDLQPESHANEVANAYVAMVGCISAQCRLCSSGPGDFCPN